MSYTWIEPFAGAAAVALRLVGGRDLTPPVAWMGGKRRHARAIADAMGVPAGRPDVVLLSDAGPWGWVWPLLLRAEHAERVAEALRSWQGEHPRELWGRLAEQPPAKDLHERAAQWLWLQARSASGVPIWWDGWRAVQADHATGRLQGASQTGGAEWRAGDKPGRPATDRGEDLRWPGHQAQRQQWLAPDGRGEPRPAGQKSLGEGAWRFDARPCDAKESRAAGQCGTWRMGKTESRDSDQQAWQKGQSHGKTGGMVNPATIADRIEAIALAFASTDVLVYHGDAMTPPRWLEPDQLSRWRVATRADPACRELADRHYSRRTVGAKQFVAPGKPLVLARPEVVWVTLLQRHQDHEWKGAWICSLFRNESGTLSSSLIRSAVMATVEAWGPLPKAGLITFVDAEATARGRARRHKPGHCYRMAGWREIGMTKGGHGRVPQVVLRSPQPAPGPVFCYLDPPYVGATGYGWDCRRAEVLALARAWEAAGAVVAVSEAEPLALAGWHHLELTRAGGKPEFLTISRSPARIPERQQELFGSPQPVDRL